MDEFGLDRSEFTGTLISLEFGPGGRIGQLWAADPALPDDSEEFQFVLGPVNFGEEFAEDYAPGTVLIGARIDPEEPWILSRNSDAELIEEEDPTKIAFKYDFSLLPEIEAIGRYFEVPGILPQVVWELELRNTGTSRIEIGELGFPFALNNLYEGFPRTDKGLKEMWADRVYVHKFIGGAASYLFAQRLNARPPGLLIFPGENTSWEFYNHVPASLNMPFRWEGIPVMYIHSQAAMEREGWEASLGEHTSLILEAGQSRVYQTRFVPADRERADNVHPTLAACGRPTMKVFPAAVAPADVGIAVEIAGATPIRYVTDVEADLETDSDEEGGFAFIRPKKAGPLRVGFEDSRGRLSEAHLFFTERIENLIRLRAEWITKFQIHREPGSVFDEAILVTDVRENRHMTDPEDYSGSFGIRSSLADALFLAEKNTIFPDAGQIGALNNYIKSFLRDDIQNPADHAVGSVLLDTQSVACNFARPHLYPLAALIYHAMYRIARGYGGTDWSPEEYLTEAALTGMAMFDQALGRDPRVVGVPAASYLTDIVEDLRGEGMSELAERLYDRIIERAHVLLRRRYPYAGDSLWTTGGYEEVFSSALLLKNEEQLERTFRCAFAARSLAPSWWWYGSDKRFFEDSEGAPHPAMIDRGEMCLGPTTPANALFFFDLLDRDYSYLPEAAMRLAFGGLLGIWALVQPDGSASMGFCPDRASKQFGISPITGDIGLSLFYYLRGVGSYVLPSRTSGVATFACTFGSDPETEPNIFSVVPWDGVGHKIVVRQVGLEARAQNARILKMRFESRKRWVELEVQNPSDKKMEAILEIRGMWGREFEFSGTRIKSENGTVRFRSPLEANASARIEVKVRE